MLINIECLKYTYKQQDNNHGLTFRCILWDLSRSFLLRLAITIFSIILIYTMAQVNVVSLSNLNLGDFTAPFLSKFVIT